MKSAIKNVPSFTGKAPVLDSLLNKIAGPHKIFKNTYLEEYLRTTASVISVEILYS